MPFSIRLNDVHVLVMWRNENKTTHILTNITNEKLFVRRCVSFFKFLYSMILCLERVGSLETDISYFYNTPNE